MTKRKVFSIIGLVLTVFLIGNMFLPLLKSDYSSISTWEYFDKNDAMHVNIIILIELIVAALFFILQICGALKRATFTLFTIGFYVTYFDLVYFITFAKNDYMQYTSFGFWLGFIVSIALLAVTVIGSAVGNEKSARPVAGPVSYDPQTGQPINQ